MVIEYFSFIVDIIGRRFYFTKKQREELTKRLPNAQWDSHSYIAMYYGINVDRCDKYWWDSQNGLMVIQLNTSKDNSAIGDWVESSKFKEIMLEFTFTKNDI